jgi:hypothetical protein
MKKEITEYFLYGYREWMLKVPYQTMTCSNRECNQPLPTLNDAIAHEKPGHQIVFTCHHPNSGPSKFLYGKQAIESHMKNSLCFQSHLINELQEKKVVHVHKFFKFVK